MEKSNIDLSIIIVDYNAKKYLLPCLQSLKKHLIDINYEVIVVDNGTKPELKVSEEEIKQIIPSGFLVVTKKNLGFGSGNNEGAKHAKGEYLLLLNPDTLMVDGSVLRMINFIKNHQEIGALTPLLYQEDGKTLQSFFYGKFQSLAGLTIRRYNFEKIDFSKKFQYSDIVTGASLMIRKELFNQLNGFDENIFMYLEDDDLCKRLVDLGYKNAILCSAKVVHLEGKSSSNREKKKYYYKSQDYYWFKHNGFFSTILMKIVRWPIKIIKTR